MLSDIVKKYNGTQIEPLEVYKDIFKLGEGYIQKENEPKGSYKANPVAYFKNNNEEHGHFRIMFEDKFEEIFTNELSEADFAVMNGLSYFGAKYVSDRASKMYAMIFDLDGVSDKSLNNFLLSATSDYKIYPLPNYIALSGNGVHLYYVFEEPIPLFPNLKLQLKELKYALTNKMWNKYTSSEEKVQKQGINQPFRVLGGKTKKGAILSRAEVFQVNTHPFTLNQLCEYVPDEFRVDESQLFKESKLTLEEAKKLYPQWYENKVLNNKKGHWTCKRDLYDWWKRQIEAGATVGHRYFCIMALAIYAVKSGIELEELEKDAYNLIPYLSNMDDEHPFDEDDVKSALECFDERYYTFPRDDIAHITAIAIKENKRNGRKQEQHMQVMRAIQTIVNPNWREGNGRKSAEEKVRQWRDENPTGRKADCHRDTGLDPKTIRKWW